jgi:hypothetical protein
MGAVSVMARRGSDTLDTSPRGYPRPRIELLGHGTEAAEPLDLPKSRRPQPPGVPIVLVARRLIGDTDDAL